ncbi:regulatory protein, Fis family [Desulfacinum hydrothermale DSM 13146]|uniref:Regulatory protein, Fis family n=1 Tax=Desulfacinum hydrothermale DSM 13146 TaxID=1121390 RepID=A0A1W1XQ06_9BACT|nr:sigma-54 dependent transcriptional regulator [Desulfacinum hydrothermale]SMC26049.1 regulatory protein, Fis family [Desulfacinum hydrothermale DSM 13146]
MGNVLVCWLGKTDIRASRGEVECGLGPIGQAARTRRFSEIFLLCDTDEDTIRGYLDWLKKITPARLRHRQVALTRPTHFGEIYEAAVAAVLDVQKRHGKQVRLTFHLSPGTPHMAAVWIILSKARFDAELIESSPEAGVQDAPVPFDITAQFVPDMMRRAERFRGRTRAEPPPMMMLADLMRRPDRRLEKLAEASASFEEPGFSRIVYNCDAMQRLMDRAERVARRSVSVLIEGESGTGKELLARHIHERSPRKNQPFQAINCGAIPPELVESELFGHQKGAFTGADKLRKGHFEQADGGTLFLDEIGELPLGAQVKILRVLQQGAVTRIGSSKEIPLDVRIIAATNRNLLDEVRAGRFRADLFYRLAVAIFKLPPIREREGDLELLVDAMLHRVNRESREDPGYVEKTLAVAARKLLLAHPWPGNVRELLNTLRRAAIWSDRDVIEIEDIQDALLPLDASGRSGILDRPLGSGFQLKDVISEVAHHYIQRALDQTNGNKSRAAELLGFKSYQTLSNWQKRHSPG